MCAYRDAVTINIRRHFGRYSVVKKVIKILNILFMFQLLQFISGVKRLKVTLILENL